MCYISERQLYSSAFICVCWEVKAEFGIVQGTKLNAPFWLINGCFSHLHLVLGLRRHIIFKLKVFFCIHTHALLLPFFKCKTTGKFCLPPFKNKCVLVIRKPMAFLGIYNQREYPSKLVSSPLKYCLPFES